MIIRQLVIVIVTYIILNLTHFFFRMGIYFRALAKLAALFFLLIFSFRSLVHLRAR